VNYDYTVAGLKASSESQGIFHPGAQRPQCANFLFAIYMEFIHNLKNISPSVCLIEVFVLYIY